VAPTVAVLRVPIGPDLIPGPAGLPSGFFRDLATAFVSDWFGTLDHWVATGTAWLLREAWAAMSATSDPVLTGTSFKSEYHVMVLIGVGTVLPLLGLAVIQAIVQQDASGLFRTAFVRLPMALLLTSVVIELVSLGLTVTDRASSAVLATGGDPTASLLEHLAAGLPGVLGTALGSFGALLVLAVGAVIAFLLWLELAVRSAAVAVAAMFLPLALAGLVWPATSHWARRLGETLAGLVLMKLVMAAVLALAAGALSADAGGISSIVEGFALLGLTVMSPFVLFRLVPMVESGAASYIAGAGRQMAHQPVQMASEKAWMFAAARLGAPAAGQGSGGGASGGGASGGGASGASSHRESLSSGLPPASQSIIDGDGGSGGSGGPGGSPAPGAPPPGAGPPEPGPAGFGGAGGSYGAG
jgi:hypothetical protein